MKQKVYEFGVGNWQSMRNIFLSIRNLSNTNTPISGIIRLDIISNRIFVQVCYKNTLDSSFTYSVGCIFFQNLLVTLEAERERRLKAEQATRRLTEILKVEKAKGWLLKKKKKAESCRHVIFFFF